MSRRRAIAALGGPVLATGLVIAAFVQPQPAASQAAAPAPASPDIIARGHYLADAGDCQACHTAPGGAPFAGGVPVPTPFGTVVSANITPDKTGIADWTPDEFYRALHEGIDDEGKRLYPAFPYNYYTLITRADSDAIFAYLKTLAPVHNSPKRDQLPFPFNIRFFVRFWNALYLKKGPFQPNPAKSQAWNRGAYLVEALGHCQACHTPKSFLGAPKKSQPFHGGVIGAWFAPDLTRNARTGLGGWSQADLLEFLQTGRNVHAAATAEMGEVVDYSTSRLTEADREAMVTYLTDQPASPAVKVSAPDQAAMHQGLAIFVDSCSACHGMDGKGTPRFFPPLAGSADLQQANPATTLHAILGGVRSTPTAARPTPLSMPAYGWKLTDAQVAAVATYVRNAWGNSAPPVTAGAAAKMRRKIAFTQGPADRSPRPAMTRPGPETWGAANTDSRDNGTANAGRAAPASDETGPAPAGGPSGGQSGASSKGHPAGSSGGGPG